MIKRLKSIVWFLVLAVLVAFSPGSIRVNAAAEIVIDPGEQFQVFEGWRTSLFGIKAPGFGRILYFLPRGRQGSVKMIPFLWKRCFKTYNR